MSDRSTSSTCSSALLLLLFNNLDIVLWNLLHSVDHPFLDIIRHITLYRNLLSTAWYLCNTTPTSKLLAKILGYLLQLVVEIFQSLDTGDVFPLVSLNTLYQDLGRGAFLGFTGLCSSGL